MNQSIQRRTMLKATAGLMASAVSHNAVAQAQDRAKSTICVFTKPFNSLKYEQLANEVADLGFAGIEAPIRQGGHIEPSQVRDELPELVEALRKRNLEITVMTTDINDPDDSLTKSVLETAAELGVKRYRLKYFRYSETQPVREQLKEWKAKLKDLAQLNRDLGIRGLYQNHAGNGYFGAALWDLAEVLEDIPKQHLAVAYDIRHATVESGMNWPTTYRLIRPHIDTVYIKDFVWRKGNAKPINVPLGEGRVSPKFIEMLAESGFDGPISLHEEYLNHRSPELVPKHLNAMKRDLATLRSWLAG